MAEGKDFRACVELTNKTGAVVAAVGETCERVNPDSLGWLLAQKLIEPTDPSVPLEYSFELDNVVTNGVTNTPIERDVRTVNGEDH